MQADLLAPELATLDLVVFMRETLYETEQAGLAGELPVGVMVIDGHAQVYYWLLMPETKQQRYLLVIMAGVCCQGGVKAVLGRFK